MALATQCPFCQTVFRVASDQLKLRDGLLRCGNCHEVFDGYAHLLPDQPDGGNHHWPTVPQPIRPIVTPKIARANAAAPNYGAPPADVLPDAEEMKEIEAAWELPPTAADAEPAMPEDEAGNEIEPGDDTLMIESEAPQAPAAKDAFDAVPPPMHQSSPPHDEASVLEQSEVNPDEDAYVSNGDHGNDLDEDDMDDPVEQPELILAVQRKQRRSCVSRLLMIVGSVILFFAAMAQGIYLERNHIALAAPRLKPLLIAACQPLRCTVGLQKRIDQLSIDSNELQAATPDQPTLILSLLLRNLADAALAWPDIELTLNDDDEKALIRRVFTPAEYLPAGQSVAVGMPGNSEQAVTLSFTLTQTVASGYRVSLFYP